MSEVLEPVAVGVLMGIGLAVPSATLLTLALEGRRLQRQE
jgi:hypothetical protein